MAIDYSEETEYLERLQDQLLQEAARLREQVEDCSDGFYDSMKYLWENRSDMDSMEIFSNRQSIERLVNSGEFTAKQLERIEKMLDSPYFARIDFVPKQGLEAIKVYIGRFAWHDDDHDTCIYDWRAPISEMYYDYEPGVADFMAPAGKIVGEITQKRQYKVKNGKLKFALESALSIGDEVLQRELSRTSDQKMKNIVATIQKEQNRTESSAMRRQAFW